MDTRLKHHRGKLLPQRNPVRMLVLGIETTGLNHEVDELICLAMTNLEVNLSNGALIRATDQFEGLQEPVAKLSDQVAQILGHDRSALVGHRLDVLRISEIAETCDLVVAHNARLVRPFVEKAIPTFCNLQWVCSMCDIAWQYVQAQESVGIDHLARQVGHRMEAFTPKATVEALASVLSQPLPDGGQTGFGALIAASRGPFMKYLIPDRKRELNLPMDAFSLVYSKRERGWSTRLCGADAELFRELAYRALEEGRIKGFHSSPLDPILRFSAAAGGY